MSHKSYTYWELLSITSGPVHKTQVWPKRENEQATKEYGKDPKTRFNCMVETTFEHSMFNSTMNQDKFSKFKIDESMQETKAVECTSV